MNYMLSSSSSNGDKNLTYLDSGCSYHTFRKTSIPKSVNIDTSDIVNIQTAHTGTFIQSSGRVADAGILKDVIVYKRVNFERHCKIACRQQFENYLCSAVQSKT